MGPDDVPLIFWTLLGLGGSVGGAFAGYQLLGEFLRKKLGVGRRQQPEAEPEPEDVLELAAEMRRLRDELAAIPRHLAALGKTVASIDELLWQMDARLRRLPTREDLRDEVRDLRAAQRRISEEQAAICRRIEQGKE